MLAKEDRPPLFASASLFIIGALFVSSVAWASFAEVDEIARGDGKIIPASKTQIIQASEPGVVQEIAVTIVAVGAAGWFILLLLCAYSKARERRS